MLDIIYLQSEVLPHPLTVAVYPAKVLDAIDELGNLISWMYAGINKNEQVYNYL